MAEFSLMKKKKPLHFISTTDVFEIAREIKEDEDLLQSKMLFNGYAQSKWIAEKILKKYRDIGGKINIYRLSRVFGDVQTGMGPTSDLFWKIAQISCRIGAFPDLDIKENITPINFIAEALVYISQKPSNINQNYHLLNSLQVHYSDLFSYLKNYGFSLKKLDYSKWKNKVIEELSDSELKYIVNLFSEENLSAMTQDVNFNCENMEKALQNSEIKQMNINEQIFKKYLHYYTKIGFLKK